MSCKYLAEGKVCRCLASQQLMVPSLFEMQFFCYGSNTDCLIYQERESEYQNFMEDGVAPAGAQKAKPVKSVVA